ncbi:hypothetical protein B4102_4083 [Heyndrickxia sporothermodurans]|uniref:Uncharacterized protein n=1 Tax=Heyndrickxia sporothermodurans TaxID=46224 RepID=A0A150KKK1_9BACI|nr:hypothetical protein B4102_4083 [Heyndrickxia sporothermodurans]
MIISTKCMYSLNSSRLSQSHLPQVPAFVRFGHFNLRALAPSSRIHPIRVLQLRISCSKCSHPSHSSTSILDLLPQVPASIPFGHFNLGALAPSSRIHPIRALQPRGTCSKFPHSSDSGTSTPGHLLQVPASIPFGHFNSGSLPQSSRIHPIRALQPRGTFPKFSYPSFSSR